MVFEPITKTPTRNAIVISIDIIISFIEILPLVPED